MDELRGPTIQIVLHIKEGVGFGFLRSPFIVSGSLNGYMLETDPAVPCHTPAFDAELVWEADKRRFRSLRVQNVPIKVEVYTLGTQGKKDKVGYFLLSLLGAQPRPSNKMIDIKHTWQRLLGVRSDAKCCQPKLLLSLSIEDRVNNITPRNELRMFHCNEVAYISNQQGNLTTRSMLLTLKEYETERGRRVSAPELQPRLLCEEGLIQLGAGRQLFVLSFLIGSVENLDVLLPEGISNKETDCYITYTVFTHDVMTDRVPSTVTGNGVSAQFNQRTSLRLRSDLSSLSRYFAECSHLITKIYAGEKDVGICSMDLRKLIPTDDIDLFTTQFCNTTDKALMIHERCFVLRCDESEARSARRPYIDVEMTLKYLGVQQDTKPSLLAARSATHLESGIKRDPRVETLDYRSGSCTNLAPDLGGVAYTNLAVTNTNRYKNASGDAVLQTTEITDLIKKMCDTFKESQEKLLASHTRPFMSDMQVQCDAVTSPREKGDGNTVVNERKDQYNEEKRNGTIERGIEKDGEDTLKNGIPCLDKESEGIPLESSRSDTYIVNQRQKDLVKLSITPEERNTIMQKFVDELEDWKEKQQEIFKIQLKSKEEYHLDLLSREWSKKQVELECKLSRGIDQCRHLAADLSRATDDFRLRGFRNCEREKKLLDAKKALEAHYTAKYQELRLASQKMEDDMMHQLKLKDMRIEELEMQTKQLEKQIDVLKNNLKNNEKENENKYSGLTKDQTANLIQELRCLEEKLDSAVQSKAFFKEQWGRAVRELHLSKLRDRRHVLARLQHQRRQLQPHGSDTVPNNLNTGHSQVDLGKLKDDFYVDLLANSPGFDVASLINSPGPNGMEIYDDIKDAPKNPLNEKLTELITQRDRLIQQDNPDENILKQLNHEIRSMLVNCT